MTWILSVNAQTDLEAIRAVRKMVHDLVEREGGAADADDMELAMAEALANAAVHAYPEAVGPVSVAMTLDNSTFTVTVQDRGHTRSVPTVAKSLPQAGKGLFLISQLVDHIALHQDTGEQPRGVSITMIKRLQGRGGPLTLKPAEAGQQRRTEDA